MSPRPYLLFWLKITLTTCSADSVCTMLHTCMCTWSAIFGKKTSKEEKVQDFFSSSNTSFLCQSPNYTVAIASCQIAEFQNVA